MIDMGMTDHLVRLDHASLVALASAVDETVLKLDVESMRSGVHTIE